MSDDWKDWHGQPAREHQRLRRQAWALLGAVGLIILVLFVFSESSC